MEKAICLECQNCGGSIEMLDSYNGICLKCRSRFVFDTNLADDVTRMLNEANKDRRMQDYDRAILGYEDILKKDPKNAEAHYGLFISTYGIRFVQEGEVYKPTCDRYNTESVFNNANYKKAIEFAVSEGLKERYKSEATEIERVRVEIQKKVEKGESYDIFICYKQSEIDNPDVKTKDSQRCYSIYRELTKAGYNVFFAEETLQNKAGEEYEPIIYTALITSKVFLLATSKTEYANAVWTKNEWSRFLKMIKSDEKEQGSLIPICLSGMSPYDLPVEVKSLQALNDTDLNFLEILKEKVSKFVNSYRAKSTLSRKQFAAVNFSKATTIADHAKIEKRKWNKTNDVVISASDEVELKNAYKFLEIKKFKLAKSKFISLIEKNPQNDSAIFGAELANNELQNEEQYAMRCHKFYPISKNEDGSYKIEGFEKLISSANTVKHQKKYMEIFKTAVLWLIGNNDSPVKPEIRSAFIETYLAYNESEENENEVISKIEESLTYWVEQIPKEEFGGRGKRTHKTDYMLSTWNALLSSYLKTLSDKDVKKYYSAIVKYAFPLFFCNKDPNVKKYIQSVITLVPDDLNARMLLIRYEQKCRTEDELLFRGKKLNQIKSIIEKILPYNEDNSDLVAYFLEKEVDNMMIVQNRIDLAFKVFEFICGYVSKKNDKFLIDKMIEFGNIALILGSYNKLASKYFLNAISIDAKDSRGHWGKLKSDMGVRDDFLLTYQKKDITLLESCKNAINCNASDKLNDYYMQIIEKQNERALKKERPDYVFNPIMNSILMKYKFFAKFYGDYIIPQYKNLYKNGAEIIKEYKAVFYSYNQSEEKDASTKKELKSKIKTFTTNHPICSILDTRIFSNMQKEEESKNAKKFISIISVLCLFALSIIGLFAYRANDLANENGFLTLAIVGGVIALASIIGILIILKDKINWSVLMWIGIVIVGIAILVALVYSLIAGIFFAVVGFIIGGSFVISIICGIIMFFVDMFRG